MPSILNWISNHARRRRTAHEFYGSIVAAARNPLLYSELGVPDTLEGRFEMLVAHMFVFLERLGQAQDADANLNQELVDLFFADMDVTTRQAGAGDMAVPKKMRELARIFSERMDTYKESFASSSRDMLVTELESLVFSKNTQRKKRAERLGTYLRQLRRTLQDLPMQDLPTFTPSTVGAVREQSP